MRRVSEALTAIGTADDHFAHFTPDNDPPFMAYYNDARHALLTGQPLADLAIESSPQSTLDAETDTDQIATIRTARAYPASTYRSSWSVVSTVSPG